MKPVHWSCSKPRLAVGNLLNQPARTPDCHLRETTACSTLLYTLILYQVFKCSSVGGPPYETAVTSNRQHRDIQLNMQIPVAGRYNHCQWQTITFEARKGSKHLL